MRLSNTVVVHRGSGAKFYQIGGSGGHAVQAGRSVAENPQKSSISEGGIILTYRGHDATRVVHGDTSVCSTMCVCVCVWSSFHNGFFPSFCEAKAGQQGSRTGSVSLASWDGAAATEEEAAVAYGRMERGTACALSVSISLFCRIPI